MEQFVNWIKIILMYKVLSTFLIELSCGEKNRKLIQLFSGILLIFIIAEPVTKLLGIQEEMLFSMVQKFEMENMRELEMFMVEGENQRNQSLLAEYTKQIEENIREFVEEEDLVLDHVQATYVKNSSGQYEIGTIRVVVSRKYNRSEAVKRAYDEVRKNTVSVEEINIKKAVSKFYKLGEDNIIYEEQ